MTQSNMRSLIVDRIENGLAVLEGDDASMSLPTSWLPRGAREGSVLRVEMTGEGDSSSVVFTLDPELQAQREAEIRELRDSIPEGPDGDIAL